VRTDDATRRDAETIDARALAETLGDPSLLPDADALAALQTMARRIADRPGETILAPDPAAPVADEAPSPLALGELLGEGGMGVVRRATQRSLGRDVAVKLLKPERRTPEAAAQLRREAWITGAVEHPNVVPVHDLLHDDRGPLVVLKRIEGDPWDEVLSDPARITELATERDSLAWHLRVLRQVCRALELAHDRGVVHRDVKPANVMLGRFGEVYLVDWGIAAAYSERADPRLPRLANHIVGTPAYMAPEMARGAAALVDERTDVYLLGATLYELLAGAPPHRGDSALMIVAAALTSEPPAPRDAPEELVSICRRAMHRDRHARFPDVASFRRAIEDHLSHRASIALAETAEERLLELESLDAEEEPERTREVFGQCRFGFLQALSTWSDNPHARRGLDRSLRRMAEVELDRAQGRAAAALLDEATEVPAELRARVDEALAREKAEREVLEALEAERRAMDPRIGRRQRVAFALLIGTAWLIGPVVALVRTSLGRPQTLRELAMWPFVMALGFGFVAWVFRRGLLRTALNRRLMGTFLATMLGFGLFHLGAMQLGLTLAVIQSLDFALFSCAALFLVPMVDRRFLLSAAAYLGGFFGATAAPEHRYLVLLATNITTVLNVLWVWPPWRASPDEGPG